MASSIMSTASLGLDVKPYNVHVSSRYLELTQKKLELTRLPHEILLPKTWTSDARLKKSDIEPLVDFWLEGYSWRAQEDFLNHTMPQYRVPLTIPGSDTTLRMHYIHIQSSQLGAVPLLVIPPFPFTNLSLLNLLEPLRQEAFDIVVPSIPGLGFSEALTDPGGLVLSQTAGLFDELMRRLGYQQYIATATGSGSASVAAIDYHIPRLLAHSHEKSCVGIHIVDPPIACPTLYHTPLAWLRLQLARFFQAEIFGYCATDWRFLQRNGRSRNKVAGNRGGDAVFQGQNTLPFALLARTPLSQVGIMSASVLAYALCDSPVGLLSLVIDGLQQLSPRHILSKTEVVNLTQLMWLPGPEAAMRYISQARRETQCMSKTRTWSASPTSVTTLDRIFVEDDEEQEDDAEETLTRPHRRAFPWARSCPAWASAEHNVVSVNRVAVSGVLIAWEHPQLIIDGTKQLLKAISFRRQTEDIAEIV